MSLPWCCSLVGFTPRNGSLSRFKVERTNQALHGRFGTLQLGTPLVTAAMFNPPFERGQDAAELGPCVGKDESAPVTVVTSRASQVSPENVPPGLLPALEELISTRLLAWLVHISAINPGATASISVWPRSLPVRLFLPTIRSLSHKTPVI